METEELLGKCAMHKECGEDYIAWAETMLMKGCSNENVEILAALGLEQLPNIFELKSYFQKAIVELNIQIPENKECVMAYAKYLAKKIVNKKIAPADGVHMLFRLCSELDYPAELIMWYEIDEDIDLLHNGSNPIYICEMNFNNLDVIIIEKARQFLDE